MWYQYLFKNSVTFIVTGEKGEEVSKLTIRVSGPRSYTVEFNDIEDRITNAEPGEYCVRSDDFGTGYKCSSFTDNFTMNEGDKLKFEYQCKKED